jgi:hypothetical protein
MTNNQINLDQEHNHLSDEDLEAVAGGGAVLDAVKDFVGDAKDFVGDVYEVGKDFVSDVGDTIKKHL